MKYTIPLTIDERQRDMMIIHAGIKAFGDMKKVNGMETVNAISIYEEIMKKGQ